MKNIKVLLFMIFCSFVVFGQVSLEDELTKSFFEEFKVVEEGVKIKFKNSGQRYVLHISDSLSTKKRISEYGEELFITKDMTLAIASRQSRIECKFFKKLSKEKKDQIKNKINLNLDDISNSVWVYKKTDLRSRGRGLIEKEELHLNKKHVKLKNYIPKKNKHIEKKEKYVFIIE